MVSATLSGGVENLWRKNGIESIRGTASLTSEGNVAVGGDLYAADAVILATGSVALPIPDVPFGERVLDTWGAWSLPRLPSRLAVVGAGASGCELASAYSLFGSEVVLIEMQDQILPAEDSDIAKVVDRALRQGGVEVLTGVQAQRIKESSDSVTVAFADDSAEVDYLIVARGRAPDVEGLGLERAGVELEEDGEIKVDSYQRTSNRKVFAIGDLVNGRAGAHKASEEGTVAAESAAGVETRPVPLGLIANAISCHPQIASVGLTESAARESGHEVRVVKRSIAGEGAATVLGKGDGLVKLVIDARSDQMLGAHMVGKRACDMLAELVATMALFGGYQDLERTHSGPLTVSTPCGWTTPVSGDTSGL